jgi:hypothetical protein
VVRRAGVRLEQQSVARALGHERSDREEVTA